MNRLKTSILSTACLTFLFVAPVWADQEYGPQKAQVQIAPQPAGNTLIKMERGQNPQGNQERRMRTPYGGNDTGFRGGDRGNDGGFRGNQEFRRGDRDGGFRDSGFRDGDRGDRGRRHHRDRDFDNALPAAAFGLINAIVNDNDDRGRRHHHRKFIDQNDTYRCRVFDPDRGYVWKRCRY